MVAWLIGIGITGFGASLLLSVLTRPKGIAARLGRFAVARWLTGTLAIAVVGVALTLLLVWPAWLLGQHLGPTYPDISEATGGAIFACIFGLGGVIVTCARAAAFNGQFNDPTSSRD